jgi:sugar lactone lactonase YvrE
LISRFSSKGQSPRQFGTPENIAIDSQDRIYIANYPKVKVLDPTGLYLDTFDIKGGAEAMIFDRQDNLFLLNDTGINKYQLREK